MIQRKQPSHIPASTDQVGMSPTRMGQPAGQPGQGQQQLNPNPQNGGSPPSSAHLRGMFQGAPSAPPPAAPLATFTPLPQTPPGVLTRPVGANGGPGQASSPGGLMAMLQKLLGGQNG